jgi:trehalose/maltose transport system permease protein
MNRQTARTINRILFWILVALVFVYMVFPFYWMINSAFKNEAQLQMTPATFLPVDPNTHAFAPTFINFEATFNNAPFLLGIRNSVIVAVSATLLALAIGSFAAFALGKLRYRGKTVSMYLILAMTMFPQVAVLSGLYFVIRNLGLPAIPSMILSYMLFTLPFTVWVLASFFRGLPLEIMQSAQVDGANAFQTFYMILLPLTAPALVTTGLLAFIAAWNEYLFALTFTTVQPNARTVPVAIALFTGQIAHQIPFGEIMAGAIIVTIPLIVLVIIFQRQIVAGLTAGAVKG